MLICFIGFGEVGRVYAQALWEAGEKVGHVCDQYLNDAGRTLATRIGASMSDTPADWLSGYDVVISAVTGSVALDVATTCSHHMRPGALYVDLTTASPENMQAAERAVGANGVLFADVGILGAVSIKKGATALVVAGTGAQAFAPLGRTLGAPLKLLTGPAGDAVRLKLLRSVFTKGLEALAVETLVAAEAQNLRQDFFDIIRDIDETPMKQLLEVLVRTHVIHARRRHHEVKDALSQIDSLGIQALVTEGVGELFHRTASMQPASASGETPPIEEALDWLRSVSRQTSRELSPAS
jgi:3-hydroxyisobutyrate dehydrogenase